MPAVGVDRVPRTSRGATIDHPKLMSWTQFIEHGRTHREAEPQALARLADAAEPADVVTLVYTSGTTGPPKVPCSPTPMWSSRPT